MEGSETPEQHNKRKRHLNIEEKMENNEKFVIIQYSDVSHIMPTPSTSKSHDYLKYGWVQRPNYWKIKDHMYITYHHNKIITQLCDDGNKDNGMNMSAASMVEATKSNLKQNCIDGHPHPKHYLLIMLEIVGVSNQSSTKKKMKQN